MAPGGPTPESPAFLRLPAGSPRPIVTRIATPFTPTTPHTLRKARAESEQILSACATECETMRQAANPTLEKMTGATEKKCVGMELAAKEEAKLGLVRAHGALKTMVSDLTLEIKEFVAGVDNACTATAEELTTLYVGDPGTTSVDPSPTLLCPPSRSPSAASLRHLQDLILISTVTLTPTLAPALGTNRRTPRRCAAGSSRPRTSTRS